MAVYFNSGRTLRSMPLYGIERALGEDDTLPSEGPATVFRLLDDDGERTHFGTLDNDDECLNQTAALRYGESDAGATVIEVRVDGKWTQEIA